jgi:hypothetical protein
MIPPIKSGQVDRLYPKALPIIEDIDAKIIPRKCYHPGEDNKQKNAL